MTTDTNLKPQPSGAQIDAEVQAALDLEAVLGIPQGRRVLLRLLERCNVYGDAFSPDHAVEARRLGEQNIGRWLIDKIGDISPTEYPQLLLDAARLRYMSEETTHVLDEE